MSQIKEMESRVLLLKFIVPELDPWRDIYQWIYRLIQLSLWEAQSLVHMFVRRCTSFCPKGLLCRGGPKKSCVSVCPCVRVSGPFWIQFLSSKLKILVQFLSKRRPKKGSSGTVGFKSEIDLGQRIIQILWRFRTSSDSGEAHHHLVRLPFGRPCSAGQF